MPIATLNYSSPFGTGNRPYLAINMVGINGSSGHIVGLVDSGADITQLPVGYASLMGYDAPKLEPINVGTAGAIAQALRAKEPCTGQVIGIPDVMVDFSPVFSSSPFVLWGRTDFMAVFGISIYEKRQQFMLHW